MGLRLVLKRNELILTKKRKNCYVASRWLSPSLVLPKGYSQFCTELMLYRKMGK